MARRQFTYNLQVQQMVSVPRMASVSTLASSLVPSTSTKVASEILTSNTPITPPTIINQIIQNIYRSDLSFDFGSFNATISNPISYLLSLNPIDLGTFGTPSTINIDYGTFV